MTKAVSNTEICFIKAVIIVRTWALYSKFSEHGVKSPGPNTIRVNKPHLNREVKRFHVR